MASPPELVIVKFPLITEGAKACKTISVVLTSLAVAFICYISRIFLLLCVKLKVLSLPISMLNRQSALS